MDDSEENGCRDSYRLSEATCRDNGRFVSTVPEVDRFWSKVVLRRQGCWLWTGTLNRWGYGTFARTPVRGVGRRVLAHRFAYELLGHTIPDGLTLDHLCGRAACVRPDHLEPVTNSENVRRRHARRRALNGAT